MEKIAFGKLLETIHTSDPEKNTAKFKFIQDLKDLSGEYHVQEVKTGRGKGGSKIAKLTNLATGVEVDKVSVGATFRSFGSPVSEFVLNVVTSDGVLHGLPDSDEMAIVQSVSRDKANGARLDEVMLKLIRAEGSRVKIVAESPTYDGEFIVLKGRRSPGRFAQAVLNLQNAVTGELIELWSYKQSAVVKSITQIAAPSPIVAPAITVESVISV